MVRASDISAESALSRLATRRARAAEVGGFEGVERTRVVPLGREVRTVSQSRAERWRADAERVVRTDADSFEM